MFDVSKELRRIKSQQTIKRLIKLFLLLFILSRLFLDSSLLVSFLNDDKIHYSDLVEMIFSTLSSLILTTDSCK